ncbi:PAS domain-containing protein [Sphingomonas prati]|uniref:PAS domain S-box-containing protein n=1 Tax=Sphingomonas prati TaxID=1843237 RepID=A0A7W9BSK0_9SPHN|nr:PAS domain-containing protein [Sphingomonas prati]MBB5729144.1 PAS domain S-box-containing protein [Sphingomonas prati]GGE84756.1 signal transduction histidine kinase [Sphingomonas prati]
MQQKEDWHLTEKVLHELGRGDPFAAAIRGTRMPMMITDPRQPDNPIVFANQAFQDLTGYSRDEIIGQNCRFLQGPDTDRDAIERLREAIRAETPINVDLLNYRRDGSTFWNALYVSPVRSEEGETQFYFASLLDVTERVEAHAAIAVQKSDIEAQVQSRTADLEAALETKSLLLHEVDHRVKNNLTMVGSLLRLQARAIPDKALRVTLETMLERVDALATVHRRLYQNRDIHRFDAGAFAQDLTSDILAGSGRDDIVLETEVASLQIRAADATALGLILNELIVNAVRHAFADERAGTLTLKVYREGDMGRIMLCDDGPGFAIESVGETIGRTLVSRLSRQLRAETVWRNANPGTCVLVSFPVAE